MVSPVKFVTNEFDCTLKKEKNCQSRQNLSLRIANNGCFGDAVDTRLRKQIFEKVVMVFCAKTVGN